MLLNANAPTLEMTEMNIQRELSVVIDDMTHIPTKKNRTCIDKEKVGMPKKEIETLKEKINELNE